MSLLAAVTMAACVRTDPTGDTGTTGPEGEISITSLGARCDGQSDDTDALRAGISAAQDARGTLVIPAGNCLIGGSFIELENVAIRGEGEDSVLTFTGRNVLMQVTGSHVSLSHLTITHSGHRDMVMFMLSGTTASDIVFDHVTLDGQGAMKADYAMGIWLADGGRYTDIRISDSTLTGFTYAFGINSDFSGILDGVTIEDSLFHGNYADDIEINAPDGTARNITVVNCTFRDNWSTHGSSGFGVGLANVQHALIKDNDFSGHPSRQIHIEDRSSDITIEGNTMSRGSMDVLDHHASYIFIINGSHDVQIIGNTIDASENTQPTFCIYVGDGGGQHGIPYNISGARNTFTACQGFDGQPVYGEMTLTETVLR